MMAPKSAWVLFSVVRQILPLLPISKWVFPLTTVLGLIAAFADTMSTGLIVLLVAAMMGHSVEAANITGLFGGLLARVAPEQIGSSLLFEIVILLVVIAIASNFGYAQITAAVRYRFSESIRNRLCKQFLEVSYDFILKRDHGQLYNVWAGESWLMGDAYFCIARILVAGCSVAIFSISLLFLSWQLFAIAAISITILFMANHQLAKPARRLGRRMKQEHERIAERMLVILQAMRALRVFGFQQRYRQGFEAASASVRRTSVAFERLHAFVSPAIQAGYLLILVVIVEAGVFTDIPFMVVLTFIALLYRLQPNVRELQSNSIALVQLEPSLLSIIGMLDRRNKTYLTEGEAVFAGLKREIRFENVSFTYNGRPAPSVDRVSFSIPAGAVTAIVGPSGAGKTTIINLLLGLYRQDTGSILFDGVPIHEFSAASWFSKVAAAGQDLELIEGTVRDNLLIARPDAELGALRDATETALIADTIERLPDGFDSWIGQHGLQLSGGQRQRLGLARALLKRPDILILDEATSALSSAVEHQILHAIRKQHPYRTLVLVTHRLETAMLADQVICLAGGRVVETGSPSELRIRKGELLRLLGPSQRDEPGSLDGLGWQVRQEA